MTMSQISSFASLLDILCPDDIAIDTVGLLSVQLNRLETNSDTGRTKELSGLPRAGDRGSAQTIAVGEVEKQCCSPPTREARRRRYQRHGEV